MKKNIDKLLLYFFLLIAGGMPAQSSQHFSEVILGSWTGSGHLFGQKATFVMKWENELNNKFIQLVFENKFTDKSGLERKMNAHAYYHLGENQGYWFDSRGMMLPLNLDINEKAMVVLWGDESTERGKTIYTITNHNQLNVQDFVLKDSSYTQFGVANYQRINAN